MQKSKVNSEDKLKLKIVVYFLIGLVFTSFGLLIAGIWIYFKTRTNKNTKIKSLVAGYVVALIIGFLINTDFVQSQIIDILYSKFPEIKTIEQTLKTDYPDYQTGYSIKFNNTSVNSSSPTTLASLTVGLVSDKPLPENDELNKAAVLVCNILNSENKSYDLVGISFTEQKSFLGIGLVHKTKDYIASCNDWLKGGIKLPSFRY